MNRLVESTPLRVAAVRRSKGFSPSAYSLYPAESHPMPSQSRSKAMQDCWDDVVVVVSEWSN